MIVANQLRLNLDNKKTRVLPCGSRKAAPAAKDDETLNKLRTGAFESSQELLVQIESVDFDICCLRTARWARLFNVGGVEVTVGCCVSGWFLQIVVRGRDPLADSSSDDFCTLAESECLCLPTCLTTACVAPRRVVDAATLLLLHRGPSGLGGDSELHADNSLGVSAWV